MKNSTTDPGIDAVLLIAFGGPQGMKDIRPFLDNIIRGKRIPKQRLERVVRTYEVYGGVSPITEITFNQARSLQATLKQRGLEMPVYVGMRNWHPYMLDTLREMADAGIRRAVGLIGAAFQSYSSCGQYKDEIARARQQLREECGQDVEIIYTNSWYKQPAFIRSHVDHIQQALANLNDRDRENARLIFSAHSIPVAMADACRYREQLKEAAELIAESLGKEDYALVYQSRSGRPSEPWLEPDICDYLRSAADHGLQAAVLCPLGFLTDHIEVMYEMDEKALTLCRELNIAAARSSAPNDAPRTVQALAAAIENTIASGEDMYPLPIVSS
jgi:ferrochelatase